MSEDDVGFEDTATGSGNEVIEFCLEELAVASDTPLTMEEIASTGMGPGAFPTCNDACGRIALNPLVDGGGRESLDGLEVPPLRTPVPDTARPSDPPSDSRLV